MNKKEFNAYCISALLFMSALPIVLLDKSDNIKVHVQKVDACPRHQNLPHNYINLYLEMDPEADILYVSGILNATEPLEQGATGRIKLLKCLYHDDEQSCEKYLEIDIDDFCAHLAEKNKIWTPIVSGLVNYDPHCPVPAGIYELREAAIEVYTENSTALSPGHWQMEMMVEYKGRMLACLRADAILKMESWETH